MPDDPTTTAAPAKKPLVEIEVSCCLCKFTTTCDRINEDKERFYHDRLAIRLPKVEMTNEQISKLRKMALVCETCYDDGTESPW